MGKRAFAAAVVLGLGLLVGLPRLQAETASALEVFLWLVLLLVAAAVGLWPSSSRLERAELGLERGGWADHIDFREGPAAAGGGRSNTADIERDGG